MRSFHLCTLAVFCDLFCTSLLRRDHELRGKLTLPTAFKVIGWHRISLQQYERAYGNRQRSTTHSEKLFARGHFGEGWSVVEICWYSGGSFRPPPFFFIFQSMESRNNFIFSLHPRKSSDPTLEHIENWGWCQQGYWLDTSWEGRSVLAAKFDGDIFKQEGWGEESIKLTLSLWETHWKTQLHSRPSPNPITGARHQCFVFNISRDIFRTATRGNLVANHLHDLDGVHLL